MITVLGENSKNTSGISAENSIEKLKFQDRYKTLEGSEHRHTSAYSGLFSETERWYKKGLVMEATSEEVSPVEMQIASVAWVLRQSDDQKAQFCSHQTTEPSSS